LNFGEKIMAKRILVDATYPQETRVVLLNDNNQIEELEYETSNKQQIKGNIYLAKIVRIEPSLQAAFIEYGHEKNGFLPFSEIHPVYYHIPSSDRDKISADLHKL
jgi:ribonuclease E